MAKGEITVWCLLGRKAGDNTQVRALAAELGCGCEEKRILARPWELLVHLGPRASLAGIDRAASSPLAAPWQKTRRRSGGKSRPPSGSES